MSCILTKDVLVLVFQQSGVGANEVQVVFGGDIINPSQLLLEQIAVVAHRSVHHTHVMYHCLGMGLGYHGAFTCNR